jgi:hypothetical protein
VLSITSEKPRSIANFPIDLVLKDKRLVFILSRFVDDLRKIGVPAIGAFARASGVF